jgi:hypothetical protein
MIEKLEELVFKNRYATKKLNEAIMKQNECINTLNALTNGKKEKSERTLWVNEDCEVVEFCCERLKDDFEHKGVLQSNEEYEKVKRGCIKEWKELQGCPYCHAPIMLHLVPKEEQKQIRITLNDIDAFTLEYVLKKEQQTARYVSDIALYTRIRAAIAAGEAI